MEIPRILKRPESYQAFAQKNPEQRTDWINPICILILGIIGVCFIYSAQKVLNNDFWLRQVIWIGIGSILYILIARIDYRHFLRYGHLIYLFSVILLLLLWTPIGMERYDSRRWLNLKFLAFQPSETAKFGVLVMTASILARNELTTLGESMSVLGKVFLTVLIPIILIFLQPDLGSALVFPPMIFSLLYVSKLSERFFMVVFGLFVLAMSVVSVDIFRYHEFLKKHDLSAYENRGEYEQVSWLPMKDYQRNRILAFVAPESVDPKGIGISWNLNQALKGVGTGGVLGKGYLQGDQAQLGYLPRSVAHNDFIFSVLAEERGFLGGILVIGIYTILLINCIRIASESKDRFGMLLCVGVSIIQLLHIFINVGMNIGLMPITGLPLPFISYGGSFILSCSLQFGLIQSVYRYRREITS
jgi:rod shape determining protein RodA